MGTYTELVLKCCIKEERPEIVHKILDYLFNVGRINPPKIPENLPDHPFFKKQNWEMIGSCASYYHCPEPLNFYDGKYLFTRSDLKNYDGEIQSFIDWLKPFISQPEGKFIGWIFGEEMKEPRFIYQDENRNIRNISDYEWKLIGKQCNMNIMEIYLKNGNKKLSFQEFEELIRKCCDSAFHLGIYEAWNMEEDEI